MFPLNDDNPHNGLPAVTWTIMALCALAFFWQLSLGEPGFRQAVYTFGVIPASLFGFAQLPEALAIVPPWSTVLTSMFLHGGFMHLAGNMLYLWIFGDNIEVAMGPFRFVVFYLLCGVVAALVQSGLDPQSEVPMIGASGAISGVLGAYLMLYPRATVRVLMFPFGIVGVPALLVLGLWFVLQLVNGVGSVPGQGGVAFWAHIGGFVAGVVLVHPFRRRGIRLFARARHRPFYREPLQPGHGPWGARDDDKPKKRPPSGPWG